MSKLPGSLTQSFPPIPQLVSVLKEQRKGDSIKFDKIPAIVIPGGEMSNFLFDDYEAILKFMNAEK